MPHNTNLAVFLSIVKKGRGKPMLTEGGGGGLSGGIKDDIEVDFLLGALLGFRRLHVYVQASNQSNEICVLFCLFVNIGLENFSLILFACFRQHWHY